jgi:hypothetical protein
MLNESVLLILKTTVVKYPTVFAHLSNYFRRVPLYSKTQVREMSKWNQQQYRSQILTLLDKANETELKEILASCRGIVNCG